MTFVLVLRGFILMSVVFWTPVKERTIKVLVVDALDGRPQANAHVDYLCDEIPHATNTSVITDRAGVAEVPYACTSGTKIELFAVSALSKEGCGSGVDASIEEIESIGVNSKPDSAGGIWCPTRISRKLKPVSGQVILFVKKPTWWQSHVAG